jgi:outer membrane protein assembly factor BamB
VAVAGGTVYGDTSTSVFALSAATGKTIWVDGNLLNGGPGAFEIQPQVADGRVYLASAYGSRPGGGVLLARRRLPAGTFAQAQDQAAVHHAARTAGRRAVEHGGGGRNCVRGHH